MFVAVPDSPDADTFRLQRKVLRIVRTTEDSALAEGSLQGGDLVLIDATHRAVAGQLVSPIEVAEVAWKPPQGGVDG